MMPSVSTFALIHGAWGSGWHWGAVPDALRALGHGVVAPDLPCDEPEATFDDYADVVVDALAGVHDDVVVVGCSLDAMPDVASTYVLCAKDRIVDPAHWRTFVPERLGVRPVELPGASHAPM